MAGIKNVKMKAPDPSWGATILAADEAHLRFFDGRRRREKRALVALPWIGLLVFLGGLFWSGLPSRAGSYLVFGGFLAMIAGPYGYWRTAFAEHRLWGLYANGFVPVIHYKRGWDPFVRWADVRAVYALEFPRGGGSTLGRQVRYVVRLEDHRKQPHHIRERDLATYFGYTEAECIKVLEEVHAVIRTKLPEVTIHQGYPEGYRP